MNLFNERILKQRFEHFIFPSGNKQKAIDKIIKGWQIALTERDLEKTKEKSIQGEFLTKFFESVLGYSTHSSGKTEWNLISSPKTEVDSQEADGSLGLFTTKNKITKAVIELKDAKTSLEKKQTGREKGYTPIEQGYLYASKFDRCNWIIVSNFKEIRLFNKNRTQDFYEKFDVLKLNEEEEFKRFYYVLNKDNLISDIDESVIDNLSKETNVQEENITKEFYEKYKGTRLKLFNHLTKNNPDINKNIILEKTQKIIDRVIFVSFCEDLGLLPPNIFRKILDSIRSSFDLSENKLWNQLKGLFYSINIGNRPMNINKFNGGLFSTDPILDNLNINDESLKELIQISDYNFESDLNVNILGHIFEQSISDIEDMKADISELETKKEGKRKKEGIYYTPEYITKYIIEQAVGGWLEDRKEELGFNALPELSEKDYKSIKIKKGKVKANLKVEAHINFWESYREILQNIKVLDPACGSGAFLIQAFDYLYKEGQLVNDELAKLKKGQRQIFDLDKHILTNNIYGVDLNEESVEITKLSLWLKTANKEKGLTALDENIKCGNSLIDDPIIADKKAFKWNEKFKEILSNGGFDVIIGNPPYINVELVSNDFKKYYSIRYKTYFKRFDTFGIFIESGISLLKQNGKLSFIVPSQLLNNLSYSKLRDLILKKYWLEEVCYVGDKVFLDVNNDVCIVIVNKSKVDSIKLIDALNFNNPKASFVPVDYFKTSNNLINIPLESDYESIYEKVFNHKLIKLSEKFNVFQGIVTGNNNVFIKNKEDLKTKNLEKQLLKTVLHGRDFNKWIIKDKSKKIIYVDKNIDINKYPCIHEYLKQFKNSLLKRREVKKGIIPWWSLQWPREKTNLDKVPKILIQSTRNPRLNTRIVATIDTEGLYGSQGINFIISENDTDLIYFLLGLLNSKLINFIFKTKLLNVAIKADYIKNIMLPKIDRNIKNLVVSKVKNILKKSEDFYFNVNSSLELLKSEFGLDSIPSKFKLFYKLSLFDFYEELKKNNLKLSMLQKDEIGKWFDIKSKNLLKLKNEIEKIEKEINQIIYKLYDFTESEIYLVEKNILVK